MARAGPRQRGEPWTYAHGRARRRWVRGFDQLAAQAPAGVRLQQTRSPRRLSFWRRDRASFIHGAKLAVEEGVLLFEYLCDVPCSDSTICRDRRSDNSRSQSAGCLNVSYLGQWETPGWEDGVNKGPKTRAGFVATTKIIVRTFGVSWQTPMDRGGIVVGNQVDISHRC